MYRGIADCLSAQVQRQLDQLLEIEEGQIGTENKFRPTHVESTVNQLINWRMCKKQQMAWSRAGAQYLLHVKTAAINGSLDLYIGRHPKLESSAA